MVFSSLTFICVFLPITFLVALVIPKTSVTNVLLVIASLVFYAYGEPVYVILLIVSSLVAWLIGILIGRMDGGARKGVLAVGIVFLLGSLGVFKYAGFAVESINAVSGAGIPVPDVALPVGISFYTFQAISYLIDVYRGVANTQANPLKMLLYVSFFPQLIAGPIVRYADIEKQINDRHITAAGVSCGLRRFICGLAKKVLIADVLAVGVDLVFSTDVTQAGALAAWAAAVGYLLQIYFDFSGYSDMAIGLARMFGFEFKENFNHPYAATTVKEFWRRWHISLSTWFREYVYFPLGGNRKGRPRTVINKIVVFLLCGLWHGAAWTFVVWGIIHGLLLLFEEYVPMRKLPKPIGWLYTMLVVMLAFVIFRADSLGQAGGLIAQMFTGWTMGTTQIALAQQCATPLFLTSLIAGAICALPILDKVKAVLAGQNNAVNIAAIVVADIALLVLLVICIATLASGSYSPFIYFRF